MTIEELIIYGKKYISSTETKILLGKATGYDSLELINHLNETISSEKEQEFKKLIKIRMNNKPTQYITNSTCFYGLDLYVDENVLIPRFETEELVENTLKIINNQINNPKVLDLCCGSGAIAITIKSKIPNSKVTMSDISTKALDVAKINRDKYNLEIEAIESDLFQNINEKYDVIISNPPYIKTNEEIDPLVKENEPSIALYAGVDGLYFYDKILSTISNYLNDRYLIAFEIGETQKEAIFELINKYLPNTNYICKKDLSNRDRMIFITNK